MSIITFSIIIPTFNSEKTIERCIQSIVNQTYTSIEILIIDGLSTDKTLYIIQKYTSLYPSIKLISEKDKGIYDAMNKGIALSNGQWLYFLGSDDFIYDNNVFENLSIEINNQQADCYYGNVKMVETSKIHMGKIDRMNLFRKNISHQSIVYNRIIFEKLGVFDLSFPVFADLDFNFRMFFSDTKILYLEQIIANFSLGGTSSTPSEKHIKEKSLIYKKAKRAFGFSHWLEYCVYAIKFRIIKYCGLIFNK